MPTRSEQDALIASMAPARLAPYRAVVNGSDRRAVELYLLDAELASQFHAAYRAIEVLMMRQRMHEELSATFGGSWYRTIYPSLDLRTKRRLDEAAQNIGRGAPEGKVVAQLMMGTWIGLTDRGGYVEQPRAEASVRRADYQSLLWEPALVRAFADRGRAATSPRRDEVSKLARSVGWARNRVNHCESVIFGFPQQGQSQHGQLRKTPARAYDDLIQLANYLDSEVAQWIRQWPSPKTLIDDSRVRLGLAPRKRVLFQH